MGAASQSRRISRVRAAWRAFDLWIGTPLAGRFANAGAASFTVWFYVFLPLFAVFGLERDALGIQSKVENTPPVYESAFWIVAGVCGLVVAPILGFVRHSAPVAKRGADLYLTVTWGLFNLVVLAWQSFEFTKWWVRLL